MINFQLVNTLPKPGPIKKPLPCEEFFSVITYDQRNSGQHTACDVRSRELARAGNTAAISILLGKSAATKARHDQDGTDDETE